MMNKKGSMVLRDVVFMMLIIGSIFIFASLFVNETATNYANTNMSEEWVGGNIQVLGNSTFATTGSDLDSVGGSLGTGILDLVTGGLKSIGVMLKTMIKAPNTLGTLVSGILIDIGVNTAVANTVYLLIVGLIWVIIIFTIYSSFLQGGKL